MPARTGEQYIKGLQQQEREVWLGGERVKDVTTHPGLANGARAIASLYDMQHDPSLRDQMTYVSPTTGDRVGLYFIIPGTRHELEQRRTMMLHWARATCGMVGRSPDFMNVTFAAWGAAAEYFGRGRPEFADNIRRYYEHIRENDLTLTHSLINLQRSRTLSGVFNLQEGTALQVKRETDAGVVVSGARVLATLGPLADEIAVYSPRLARHTEPHSPFALNFAIPCGTPGLKFLCRESFDLGRSHFDHPLGSRFEEMDCVVFFDDVLVPWERVFLLGDVDLLNGTAMTTHSAAHTAHQGAAKNLAKCEFVLGEADFQGPLAPIIEQYLATDTATARDRVKLFRLAWDVAGTAFGGRQVLYERFFASDPLSRARVLNAMYPKDEVMERVRKFLRE